MAGWEEAEIVASAAGEQATEQKPACGPGNEDVAVERLGKAAGGPGGRGAGVSSQISLPVR